MPIEKNVLVKWIDVLDGRKNGIQIWACLSSLRDYINTFESQIQKIENDFDDEDVYNQYLSYIHDEISNDKIAMINLSFKYYMVINRKRKTEIELLKNKKQNILSLNYSDECYKIVNNAIEKAFESAMILCYSNFSKITEPLLTRQKINELVAMYKSLLPQHYECSMRMLGFDKKISLKKTSSPTNWLLR